MLRRIELILGIGTALAAIGAIVATIFVPMATTGLSVDGGAPVIHHIYARDHGLVPMLAVIAFIAALAVCVLLGAYYHTQHGSMFACAIMWAAALVYVVLIPASLWQGSFTVYPAVLALACALSALIPSRRRSTVAEAQLHHG